MKPEQIIVNTLAKLKIPVKAFPWIIGQSAHETATKKGPFTSPVFISNNNLFGMKYPRRRKTTAISPGTLPPSGEGPTPYAKYKNLEDSVADLVLWLRYNRIAWEDINSEQEYASFLFRKGYFGDTLQTYIKGIRYWISKIKIPQPIIIGVPVFILGAMLLYILSK